MYIKLKSFELHIKKKRIQHEYCTLLWGVTEWVSRATWRQAVCSQGVGVCITSRVYVCVKYETLHIGTSGRMCGRVVGYGVWVCVCHTVADAETHTDNVQ